MSESQEALASESQVAATLEAAPVQPDSQSTVGELSPGTMLRAARETQALAIERIADDLHLSKATIEAIEADEYAVFSAPVFAKGHLRRYAVRVGVNAEEIISGYERLDAKRQSRVSEPRMAEMTRNIAISSSTTSFRISPRSGSTRGGSSPSSIALWIIAAVVVMGALAWTLKSKFVHDGESPLVTTVVPPTMEPVPTSSAPTEKGTATNATSSSAAAPSSPPVSQQNSRQISETIATTSTAPTAAANNPAVRGEGGKLRIQLRYTEDSWTEIVDGTGKVMLYDVGRVDLPRVIDVVPPARVLVGNASAVSVQVNGRPLTIPPHRIVSAVGRFTINADGSVR